MRIAWDLGGLKQTIGKFEKCIASLDSLEKQMTQIQAGIEGAWQSEAGAEYGNRLEDDLKQLRETQTQLKKFLDNLSKARSSYYAQAQLDVGNMLDSTYGQLLY